jgi:ATP-dependent DNA ligase
MPRQTVLSRTNHGPSRLVWVLAILIYIVSPHFQPMPLLKRAAPFDDDDWLFELKYDGFRALAVIEHGRAQLLSRNGHPFASFAVLGKQIAAALPNARAVIDDDLLSFSP